MRRPRLLLTVLALLGGVGARGDAPGPSASPELARVLAEFDRAQAAIRSLSAEFVDTTRTPLLKEPVVSEGQLYLTKPDSVRWEYRSPEEMRFVIAHDEYTGYFPTRKQAEKRDVRRWREHLFRFMGLGQTSAELTRFYDLRLGPAQAEGPAGAVLLLLEPKRKRARKQVDEVRLWVDGSTWLPVRIEYAGASGTLRRFDFTDVRLNPELAAGLYRVDLPPDVAVTEGFSALSGLAAAPTP